VSAGGTLVELFGDRQFALAPFDEQRALQMIERLAVGRILDGVRGAPAKDKRGAARALAAFSTLCAALGDAIAEADVNPLVVADNGAVAVDALLIAATPIGTGSAQPAWSPDLSTAAAADIIRSRS
jgi:acetyltransferase